MALKQFLNPATRWIPQSGYTVTVGENGGAEAMQDVLIRKSDLDTTVASSFKRGTRWQDIFPEVPQIYRELKLKTVDPTDRGDGMTMLKCTFTGYSLTVGASSGEEVQQATSTLTGQLTPEPLSNHPKWVALSTKEKNTLGKLISGEWTYILDPFPPNTAYVVAVQIADGQYIVRESGDQLTSDDAKAFAVIISEGETTYDRGGWTYSYHTESETGFTSAELNAIGKIDLQPPGNPKKPSSGYTWQLAAPNQSQSGDNRFMKTLDFRLIPDNAKNQFLYGE
jgi:predicted secreted protein